MAATLGVLATACDESPTGPSVPFRLIANGPGPFDFTQEVRVVRDRGTWTDVLAELRIREPLPPIDFSSEMAIVITHAGGFCDRVNVEEVTRARSGLEITAAFERSQCVCILIAAAPFAVVAVPRSDRTVSVRWLERTTPCR